MKTAPTQTPCNNTPSHSGKITDQHAALVALTSLLMFFAIPSAQADPLTINYNGGNSSTISGAGIKLDLSAIPTFSSSTLWELTSFTWLAKSSADAAPTGRGYILIFDAELFSPTGKTFAQVNADTTGLVAISETWSDGAYRFTEQVILDQNKTYFILNSSAITTGTATPAPYEYGFSTSAALTGVERWVNNSTTWAVGTGAGAPNFSATFTPIPEPSTVTALLGLASIAFVLYRRSR